MHQAGIHIGNEILDPSGFPCLFNTCRYSDAALFSTLVPIQFGTLARTTASSGCEDCSAPLTIDHSNPTFQITGQYAGIIENEVLHKVGRTTGWTYGGVEDTCTDYTIDGWVRLCSDRVDYSIKPGDSGSPVFTVKSDGTVALRGISFGYEGWPYSDALMSNIKRVELDLGALRSYDPGPPTVTIYGPSEVQAGAICRWEAWPGAGIPPYTYQWSGPFSGNAAVVEGSLQSSAWLQVVITDFLGRTGHDTYFVDVEGVSDGEYCPEA
jgi:hypothetical protein